MSDSNDTVFVDVIVPVHNASKTIVETVKSAIHQTIPPHIPPIHMDVQVCCYDDGSTDDSWSLLCQLKQEYDAEQVNAECIDPDETLERRIPTRLEIASSPDGVARGAGYARNQAASMRDVSTLNHFLCLLDSDDIMHETRIAEQVQCMLSLAREERERTILGCTFDRDPPDSTSHYTNWANGLTDDRLYLEKFREVTILQPTWMMCKSRFQQLGGYITTTKSPVVKEGVLRLVLPDEPPQSLRLAEDLRFFHAHLCDGGLLRLHRTKTPLVTYRHTPGMSQSSQTPRLLLLRLRVMAFERTILDRDPLWSGRFVIWGAGRDGKDFLKALSPENCKRVACFVDVDERKINAGYYHNRELGVRIPILHFSWLAKDSQKAHDESRFGRIEKSRATGKDDDNEAEETTASDSKSPRAKRPRLNADVDVKVLPSLPVVVCVAMYRTNGALEANVQTIGRMEGKDLWHFS